MVGLGVDLDDLPGYVGCNDLATAVLLAGMARAGVHRLVLASSMVVYGEGAYACAEHGPVRPGPRVMADLAAGRFEPPCPACGAPLSPELVDEEAPLDPRSVYAATKVAQEHLTACWARQAGGTVVALRYHNVYGPGMPRDTPYSGVAAIFRSAVEAGRAPLVFEDGRQRRDFVHVEDVAAAFVAALERPEAVGGIFNVGSGRNYSILEVAERLAAAMGRPQLTPEIVGKVRIGDIRHCFADITLAQEKLGYTPRRRLEDSLGELTAWVKTQRAIDRADQARRELEQRGLMA
jgi:dTDP-L-rhamnose 4-epimerase